MLVDVGAFLKAMKRQKSKVLEVATSFQIVLAVIAEESGHPKVPSGGKIMSLYTHFERLSE